MAFPSSWFKNLRVYISEQTSGQPLLFFKEVILQLSYFIGNLAFEKARQ